LRLMAYNVEAAGLPFKKSQPLVDRVETEIPKLPVYCVTTKLLIPALSRALARFSWHRARCRGARLAFALKCYRSQHGKYPETLTSLVPGFLPVLPPDPFTGAPYAYQPEGEGFVIYSLGANGKDDGGMADPKRGGGPDVPFRFRK